jgi:hypothetical protein
MWSSSFAGSICASISAIGRGDAVGVGDRLGVGDGANVGVGLGVAVGATDGLGDVVKVTTRPGIASHATKITARRRPRALILLG